VCVSVLVCVCRERDYSARQVVCWFAAQEEPWAAHCKDGHTGHTDTHSFWSNEPSMSKSSTALFIPEVV